MKQHEREYILSKLYTGCYTFAISNVKLRLVPASIEDNVLANEEFQVALEEARDYEMFNEEELKDFLISSEYWTDDNESKLRIFTNDIDEFKVKLFQHSFKSHERTKIRAALGFAREQVDSLIRRKYAYDHFTDIGYATACKMKWLLLRRTRYLDGSSACDMEGFIDKIVAASNQSHLNETVIRELARTEPWRSIWTIYKRPDLIFNNKPIELLDEQKSLILWTQLYDSVAQSSEAPHDSIIEDDDMLDGWLILQRRKREQSLAKKEGEELISNEKISKAGEIVIFNQSKRESISHFTPDEIKKIDSINDTASKIAKTQRLAAIRTHGAIKEVDMPDTKQQLMMQVNQMMFNKKKG